MKRYLIGIKTDRGVHVFTSIYGDTPARPFSIAGNLWNYATPWHAERRLKSLAISLSRTGRKVTGFYGTIDDMPTKGHPYNVAQTLHDWRES